MIKRQGIIVYLYYNRDLRKIAKFGDVVYHSYKMRYVHLYVDEDKVEDILKDSLFLIEHNLHFRIKTQYGFKRFP